MLHDNIINKYKDVILVALEHSFCIWTCMRCLLLSCRFQNIKKDVKYKQILVQKYFSWRGCLFKHKCISWEHHVWNNLFSKYHHIGNIVHNVVL